MITTVTLNPALDKLMKIETIVIGEANRTETLSATAAGKGIDVAKVLRDFDIPVTATGFLGGITAPVFKHCFATENIIDRFVEIADTTRTNIQLFDHFNKRTELLEKGPEVTEAECAELLNVVEELSKNSTLVAICGSAPRGVEEAYFTKIVKLAQANCKDVIVDASGKLLKVAIDLKPNLIKPNQSEMYELMGVESASNDEMIAYAQELVSSGIEYVLISLGKDGAMLVCKDGVYQGGAPEVEVKSTLGCGDTMVASMCESFVEGDAPDVMLKKAIALSSANAMTFETAHVIKDDYEAILPRCEIVKIK